MPHDKHGNLLAVGDEVTMRCKVIAISEGETACNITTEALERPEGEGYFPQIAGNSRFYEKIITAGSPALTAADFPNGMPTVPPPESPCPLSTDEVIADKQLRVAIDIELQRLKTLPPSRERSLCRTKLEESVMWLGMDLKRLGTPNPYPNSKDPSNTVVDPTADGLKL